MKPWGWGEGRPVAARPFEAAMAATWVPWPGAAAEVSPGVMTPSAPTASQAGARHSWPGLVPDPSQESIWGFRYSTEGTSRSLYYSHDVGQLRRLHPDVAVLHVLGDETRLVVSEPLLNLPGAWIGVPESSAGIVRPGVDQLQRFAPIVPG